MSEQRVVASLVGSTFYRGASNLASRLAPGNPLILQRQPNNPYDKNAVGVFWGNTQLGHIPRDLAKRIAPLMDAGVKVTCVNAAKTFLLQLTWDEPDVDGETHSGQ